MGASGPGGAEAKMGNAAQRIPTARNPPDGRYSLTETGRPERSGQHGESRPEGAKGRKSTGWAILISYSDRPPSRWQPNWGMWPRRRTVGEKVGR